MTLTIITLFARAGIIVAKLLRWEKPHTNGKALGVIVYLMWVNHTWER